MFIYAIVNSATLKIYIGQHKGKSLQKYLQDKLSAAKIGQNQRSHLFASMRKHPRDVWSIHPLISDLQTREDCDTWERVLIQALKSQHPDVGYNICRGGEGRTGPHSEAYRIKYRGVPKPEGFGDKIRQALTGRTWTPEQREKIPEGIRRAQSDGRMHRFTSEEMEQAHKAAAITLRGVSRPPEAMAGCHTPEAREKRTQALRGRTHTATAKQHMSEGKRQEWATRKNRNFSAKRNSKIAATMRGRTPEAALMRAHDPEVEARRQLTRFLKTVAWG